MQPHNTIIISAVATITLTLAACGSESGNQGKSTPRKQSLATITFHDGEVLKTNVVCYLEPQISAGQEILYTATSLSNPYFDLTVFGEDSSFPGANVSWDETTDFEIYQASWSSRQMPGESPFTLELQGSTITGSVTLMRGKDEAGEEGETRQAQVRVDCAG